MAAVKPQHYGSTRSGLREWLLQRVSAVYVAGFALYFIGRTWWQPFPDQASWIAYLSVPAVRLGLTGFLLATLLHAWIGIRSVALDYVHRLVWRLLLLALVALTLLMLGLWGVLLLVMGVPA